MDQRINSVLYVKVLNEPMKFLLSVSSSKEMGDHTRQRKQSLTSAGIQPTASGFDRPLLYQLSYEARREQVVREMVVIAVNVNMKDTNECCASNRPFCGSNISFKFSPGAVNHGFFCLC